MRGQLAMNALADQRHQGSARKQVLDGPDAGIARFQHVAALNAHHKPDAVSAKPLRAADMGYKVFGHVDFQHSHCMAPTQHKVAGHLAGVSSYPAIGIFYVAPPCQSSITVADATTNGAGAARYLTTQTANAITYSAISAPMMIVIGRAFSIRGTDSLLRKRGLPTPTCCSDKNVRAAFSFPVCGTWTAPTPGGRCNQSSSAALFQVRS